MKPEDQMMNELGQFTEKWEIKEYICIMLTSTNRIVHIHQASLAFLDRCFMDYIAERRERVKNAKR